MEGKVTDRRFICMKKRVTAVSDVIPTFNTEEGFVNIKAKISRNLKELEQMANFISGDTVGAMNSGVSESYSGQADNTRD